MKPFILLCVLGISFTLVGCFRVATGRGAIYYEATTPQAVLALRSRIETLRTTLSNDRRFVENADGDTLNFAGTEKEEFEGCRVRYNRDEHDGAKDQRAVLVVSCPQSLTLSSEARDLRKLVEGALGDDALKLLQVRLDSGLMDVR